MNESKLNFISFNTFHLICIFIFSMLFLLFFKKLFFHFTIIFERMIRFFSCLFEMFFFFFFIQVPLLILLPCDNITFICLSDQIFVWAINDVNIKQFNEIWICFRKLVILICTRKITIACKILFTRTHQNLEIRCRQVYVKMP